MAGNLIDDNGFPEAEAKVNKHLHQPMINASVIGTFADGIEAHHAIPEILTRTRRTDL